MLTALLWLPVGLVAGVVLGSLVWVGAGWLSQRDFKRLGQYAAWLDRKAGLDPEDE